MSDLSELFDQLEEDPESVLEESPEKNTYLRDREEGLALIHRLLTHDGPREADRAGILIDGQLMPYLHELEDEQQNAVNTLLRVKTQAAELHKVNLLSTRSVLGVGGKFSAGKSCFINSLTGAGLPEGQRPTTSIATYIVYADQAGNQAITARDTAVDLDGEAVEALTHEFSTHYGIGFARIVENLVIRSNTFRYPNIAILDTPGYSKSDLGKGRDATDEEIARRQLRSTDALVWLMDIESGVINESDLSFLESLHGQARILFVFNKADLRSEEKAKEIVEETKNILNSHPELRDRTYAVIAYSSWNGKTVIGGSALEDFLKEVGALSGSKASLSAEVVRLKDAAERDILNHRKRLRAREAVCEKIIADAKSPQRLGSVVHEMSRCHAEDRRLENVEKRINDGCNNLIKLLKSMEKRAGGTQKRAHRAETETVGR